MCVHIQLTGRKLKCILGLSKRGSLSSPIIAGILLLSLRSRARNPTNHESTNQTFRLGSASHYFFLP